MAEKERIQKTISLYRKRQARRASDSHFAKAISEVVLPTLSERGNFLSAAYRRDIFIVESFCHVQPRDFRDGYGVWVIGDLLDLIACADFSFA